MNKFEMNELIEEYAIARTKHYADNGDYWKGVMHTYQKMLNVAFGSEWTKQGTIGHFVFYESMNYEDAGIATLRLICRENSDIKETAIMFGSGSHARRAS